jgi:two-component system, NarL family, response regulator DesR
LIRTVVAEDLRLVRAGLVALLASETDIEVVADLAIIDQVVPVALAARPDVLVLDLDAWQEEGITAIRELHERLPACRTLALTCVGNPGYVRDALAAHALGCIVKDARPDRLVEGIRCVAKGQPVIDPELTLAALLCTDSPLTPRELDVLRIAAEGASAHEIASRLFLSVGTVRNYLSGVIRKTGARNRVDAIRIATESGWL